MLFISVNISAISCDKTVVNSNLKVFLWIANPKFWEILLFSHVALRNTETETIPVESQVKGVCNDSTEIQSRSSRNKRKTSESFNQTETKIFERFELDGADVKYTWDFSLGLVCYANI